MRVTEPGVFDGTGITTVYSTCPSILAPSAAETRRQIIEVGGWTEAAGLRGLLVYTANNLVDPWAVSQLLIERTEALVPMVAIQPAYMHPFTAARKISTIAHLFGRRVDINLVTGGTAADLTALGTPLEHDERYVRLLEYATVLLGLLSRTGPVESGPYYPIGRALLRPPMPPELLPRVFVAGSSAACIDVQHRLGATRLTYPRHRDGYAADDVSLRNTGIRLGIIARDTGAQARALAERRFPHNPQAERIHKVSARTFDSHWQLRQEAEASQLAQQPEDVYWLRPFRTNKTYCPYLVGSHEEVGAFLAGYFALGTTTLITDTPTDPEDLEHAKRAIRHAEELAGLMRTA